MIKHTGLKCKHEFFIVLQLLPTCWLRSVFVTPQNVILMQNVIKIAAKCNTNTKCININAKCNKIVNAKCNNFPTQNVITFLAQNVITPELQVCST